jgi:hypothetical protein
MSHASRIARWLGLGAVSAVLAAGASCGGGGVSRESARDQATTATCMRFDACGDNMGKTYPSTMDCELQWQANWDKAWPAASCEGKIDPAALSTCLSAIQGTSCDSVLDFLATLGKCGSGTICHATADAGGG